MDTVTKRAFVAALTLCVLSAVPREARAKWTQSGDRWTCRHGAAKVATRSLPLTPHVPAEVDRAKLVSRLVVPNPPGIIVSEYRQGASAVTSFNERCEKLWTTAIPSLEISNTAAVSERGLVAVFQEPWISGDESEEPEKFVLFISSGGRIGVSERLPDRTDDPVPLEFSRDRSIAVLGTLHGRLFLDTVSEKILFHRFEKSPYAPRLLWTERLLSIEDVAAFRFSDGRTMPIEKFQELKRKDEFSVDVLNSVTPQYETVFKHRF